MSTQKSPIASWIVLIYAVLLVLRPTLKLSIQYFRESIAYPETSHETERACVALESALSGKVVRPWDKRYKKEQAIYWSKACSDAKPSCMVLPTRKEDVETAVKILNVHDKVNFAVKSGGHSPNLGHSSIAGGVLIALNSLAGVSYDERTGLAKVKPGGKWSDVIGPLEEHGVTVVSGRVGSVGIGGFLTGGGLSFLSAQYGMGADSVVNFETVLPNGTIANINATSNPEILRAMRGSSNQFGIVTEFTLKTYPIGKVWGGTRIYSASAIPAILEAFADFTEEPLDPKADIIITLNKVADIEAVLMFYFYDGPIPPKGAFKQFEDIPKLIDNTKTRTYKDLLNHNVFFADKVPANRKSFRSLTLPHIPSSGGLMQKSVVDIWKYAHDLSRKRTHGGLLGSLALQSFSSAISQRSADTLRSTGGGGNAMGLKSTDGPRFIIEIAYIWMFAQDDELVEEISREITDYVERANHRSVGRFNATETRHTGSVHLEMKRKDLTKVEMYNPHFLNDAMFDQGVLQSYDRYEEFRNLQRSVDLDGHWRKRIGGFKY